MKKRKLVMDDLAVDSFSTGAGVPVSGTVHAFGDTTPLCNSQRICGPKQDVSDAPITCDYDCTVSQYTYCPEWCAPASVNSCNC